VTNAPELSVILSTLGNYDVLRRVLDGYGRQTAEPGSFEVLVVVDCMDPEPAKVDEAIGERPYPVRRLRGRIPGLSSNRNVGWQASEARLVLFTDNDTIPVPEFIAEHLDWHRRNPEEEVAVVGHIRWAREIRLTPFMKWLDEGVQFDLGSVEGDEAAWAHLYGANSSLKRAFVRRVGGYDEERLPYLYEDLDFAYRGKELGLRVLYNRRAVVDHVRPGMTLEFWKSKVPRLAASEREFVRIHPEMEPWFFNKFSAAARLPPLRGRAAKLAPYVPESVPWLGPRVWENTRRWYWQELAPVFLAAWEEAETKPMTAEWLAASSDGVRAQSADSTTPSRSRGSQPGGS
jgi:glycosyltransferase involved in cell wall biosynthesis